MGKRVICLATLGALALANAASADLIGWWKLDDGTGTVVTDSSGNGINGNFVGNPVWATGMNDTGALELDGSSWVDFGSPPQTLFTGAMPLSIALWINPTNLGTILAGSGHDRAFVARNQDYAFKASGPYARFTTPGVLDHNAQKTVLKVNEWQHVAVTFQPSTAGGCVFYLDGVETDRLTASAYNAAAATAGATAAGGPFLIGMNQWATNQMYFGRYDDVRLYNNILTAAEVKELAFRAKAYKPNPADKAVAVSQPLFQWQPGSTATFHSVYIGTSLELTQADLVGSNLPFAMFYFTAGLQPGQTYYWRVDEVEAGGTVHTGDVWSFTATPKTAWAQKPADGSAYMPPTTLLEWMAGMNAVTHDVYLGTDRAAVEAGDPTTKKVEKLPATSYSATNLERGKTYYWRVDETLSTGSQVTGDVWSFTVRPVIAKTDPDLLGWWKLDDEKSPFVVDYSGNDYYGTLAGSPQWVEGNLGGGLKFNGSTDYVDLGTPPALYLPTTYTYSAWFKVGRDIAGNSGAQYLLCIGSRSDLVFGVEDAVGVNGDLSLHYYDTAPGFHALSVGQTVWSSDEWHMVTATRDATGHKIYLDGELRNSDTNTLNDNYNTTRMISIGARGWTNPKIAFFNGTIDDVRIYGKALTEDEIKLTMRGDLLIAWDPQPQSNVNLDIRDATDLKWSAGDTAAQHDVYLGKDKDAVKAADTTSPLYQGRQTGASFSLDGLVEFGGGAYVWRIDEVEADGTTIHQGVVWSFTIPGYLIVDEFEAYTDNEGSRIYETWIDGFTDGLSGSTVGNLTAPFAEQTIIHDGKQSMPLLYDNTAASNFSEALRTFDAPQDWTANGIKSLSLYFQGAAGNGGQLYVKINNTKVPYNGNAGDIAKLAWVPWNIDLSTVGGNLSKVTKLAIGIEGAGAKGIVYIDDIRLYPKAPEYVTPTDPGKTDLLALYAFEGNVNDTSGHGLNGTLKQGTLVSSGRTGGGSALQIMKAGSVDLGNPPVLDFSTGDWALTAWYKNTMTGTNDADKGTIIGKGGDNTGGKRYCLIMSETTSGVVTLVTDDDVTKYVTNSTSVTNDDQWHFVVGQRAGTRLEIYIDGQLEGFTTIPAAYDLSGTSQHDAYVGAMTYHPDGTLYKLYNGLIDEVHVYNRALSQAEILWLAGQTAPVAKPL